MQTLTATVFPCYAAADRKIAERLAGFLDRGANVRIYLEEGAMQPGEDLAAKAREARMADVVLVLFSRESLPPRWPRAQWEDALLKEPQAEGVRIGFVRCDDCAPPKVLHPMFDTTLNGLRQIKRWIRNGQFDPRSEPHHPELEVLGIAIADRPGAESVEDTTTALEFARVFREDFDGIVVLECGERSTAALAGDLTAQLGMRLEGPLDSNLERLRDFCRPRRLLLVLTAVSTVAADPFMFGGHCSTLISTASAGNPDPDPIREAQHVLAHRTAEWSEICRHARIGRRELRDQGRFAECYELMQQWRTAATTRGDRAVLDESTRELVWILQGWGFDEEAQELERERVQEFADQMTLPFEGRN